MLTLHCFVSKFQGKVSFRGGEAGQAWVSFVLCVVYTAPKAWRPVLRLSELAGHHEARSWKQQHTRVQKLKCSTGKALFGLLREERSLGKLKEDCLQSG